MSINSRIKELIMSREDGNRSEFARKIGLPGGRATLVHKWVDGVCAPRAANKQAICAAYGVTLGWLNGEDVCESSVDVAPPPSDHISPIVERLLAALEAAQRDGAEKTANIARLTDTNAKLADASAKTADTNAVLADTNAKLADEAIMMSKRLEKFFTNRVEPGEMFPPTGKLSNQ